MIELRVRFRDGSSQELLGVMKQEMPDCPNELNIYQAESLLIGQRKHTGVVATVAEARSCSTEPTQEISNTI